MLDFQVAVACNSFIEWSDIKKFIKFIKRACNRELLRVQFKKIKRQAKNYYTYNCPCHHISFVYFIPALPLIS
jgi:hypothetical protein